jgi:RNA polymerase sigma-70 factor (ECF subfamily)
MSYLLTYQIKDIFNATMAKPEKKFSRIYDQYINKIYRFIFLKVNSQEIAQDLCSETFLKGWEAFKKNAGSNPGPQKEIENIQAFLYQIARNLVIDHYREKGKVQMVSVEYTPVIDPRQNLEEKSILNSEIEQIRSVLANLKDDYQNVIIWHYLDDLPIREVAKIMDRTEEATRVLLHRALGALRRKVNSG